jgi:hypothetical protein
MQIRQLSVEVPRRFGCDLTVRICDLITSPESRILLLGTAEMAKKEEPSDKQIS